MKISNLKEMIRELIDEMTGTGAVSGFATPYAFSGEGAPTSKKKKKGARSKPTNESVKTTISEGNIDLFYMSRNRAEALVKILQYNGYEASLSSKGINPSSRQLSTNASYDDVKQALHQVFSKLSEAGKAKETEHTGAKKGKGAFYGRKADAKKDSNRVRRETDKKAVQEGGDPYYAWRNDETASPRMKIGKAISEINKQLHEVEQVIKRSARLKKEMGVPNSGLWQRTNNAFLKMEGRINRIAATVRNMRG
jgi:hypothetical protein